MMNAKTVLGAAAFALFTVAALAGPSMATPDVRGSEDALLQSEEPLDATPVDASARCVQRWEACYESTPAPGNASGHAAKCDRAFRKCVKADKKVCKKACKDRKQAAKAVCKRAFREERCPNGGPERKACVKAARREKKECMKAASANCNQMCK